MMRNRQFICFCVISVIFFIVPTAVLGVPKKGALPSRSFVYKRRIEFVQQMEDPAKRSEAIEDLDRAIGGDLDHIDQRIREIKAERRRRAASKKCSAPSDRTKRRSGKNITKQPSFSRSIGWMHGIYAAVALAGCYGMYKVAKYFYKKYYSSGSSTSASTSGSIPLQV